MTTTTTSTTPEPTPYDFTAEPPEVQQCAQALWRVGYQERARQDGTTEVHEFTDLNRSQQAAWAAVARRAIAHGYRAPTGSSA